MFRGLVKGSGVQGFRVKGLGVQIGLDRDNIGMV